MNMLTNVVVIPVSGANDSAINNVISEREADGWYMRGTPSVCSNPKAKDYIAVLTFEKPEMEDDLEADEDNSEPSNGDSTLSGCESLSPGRSI